MILFVSLRPNWPRQISRWNCGTILHTFLTKKLPQCKYRLNWTYACLGSFFVCNKVLKQSYPRFLHLTWFACQSLSIFLSFLPNCFAAIMIMLNWKNIQCLYRHSQMLVLFSQFYLSTTLRKFIIHKVSWDWSHYDLAQCLSDPPS